MTFILYKFMQDAYLLCDDCVFWGIGMEGAHVCFGCHGEVYFIGSSLVVTISFTW